MADVDPARCPLCGQPNACAIAAGATRCEDCWCGAVRIAPATLAAIPPADQGRACLCRACATAPEPLADAGEATGAAAVTTDPGGRPAVRLTAAGGDARIAQLGAQVLSWRSAVGDVLWTGSAESYAPGKAVRGGVPIVFPWFGAHPDDPTKPQHGFARTLDWRLAALGPGARARFVAQDDAATRTLWPHRFTLAFDVALDDRLHLALTVVNRGDAPFAYEEALHTYFALGDVATASVHGLEGAACVEHAKAPDPHADLRAPVRFRAETDRVYQGAPARVELRAPALSRVVTLDAPAARSAIVWSPWPAKAATLSGLGPDDWQRFCCVETANVKQAARTLAPGARATLRLTLSAHAG